MELKELNKPLFEVCVNTLDDARLAASLGARRIELCSALELGGLTPSPGMIKQACAIKGLDVNVLIRCRPGDFHYSTADIDAMIGDVEYARDCGAAGIVIGALTPQGHVDIPACKRLIDAKGDMTVTFNRAFDLLDDMARGLAGVLFLGCDRLLTSGLAPTARQGVENIIAMQQVVGNALIIMPGCGINSRNLPGLMRRTGCTEFHGSCKAPQRHPGAHVKCSPAELKAVLKIMS